MFIVTVLFQMVTDQSGDIGIVFDHIDVRFHADIVAVETVLYLKRLDFQ